ncbi:hypothetical protein Tco_0657427 [Tanacetum coccineum]|uniref:Uncharacterized protein n=1 Tax=Tanacetum coccineum TaxID=301880 RepID=A0ABQ4XCC8_9ASTR
MPRVPPSSGPRTYINTGPEGPPIVRNTCLALRCQSIGTTLTIYPYLLLRSCLPRGSYHVDDEEKSPGYIPEYDPEAEPEEDDEEILRRIQTGLYY